jgi:hypothetical protein
MPKYLSVLFGSALCLVSIACQVEAHTSTSQVSPSQSQSHPGANEKTGAQAKIQYKSERYRFTFRLPASWKGYSVIEEKWGGTLLAADMETVDREEEGPQITIRHPLWTEQSPRQDIPIMVFTIAQWKEIDRMIVSAAPIGPSEIGRNSHYVFALPPRYNYASPEGWQEVDAIVRNHPIRGF